MTQSTPFKYCIWPISKVCLDVPSWLFLLPTWRRLEFFLLFETLYYSFRFVTISSILDNGIPDKIFSVNSVSKGEIFVSDATQIRKARREPR